MRFGQIARNNAMERVLRVWWGSINDLSSLSTTLTKELESLSQC